MVTTKNVLAVVGVVSLAALIAKKAGDQILSNIIVTPGNPQLDQTPFMDGYVKAAIPITIENNNLFPIGLTYFKGVVSFGTVILGNVSINTPFVISAGTTKTITLNLDIPIIEVFDDILDLITSGNIWSAVLNKIELNGNLQVQGNLTNIPIPLNNIAIPIVS